MNVLLSRLNEQHHAGRSVGSRTHRGERWRQRARLGRLPGMNVNRFGDRRELNDDWPRPTDRVQGGRPALEKKVYRTESSTISRQMNRNG